MAEQILVPLKRDDRIEEIVPYDENVTQPGIWLTMLTGIQRLMERLLLVGAAIAVRKMVERYSCSIRT